MSQLLHLQLILKLMQKCTKNVASFLYAFLGVTCHFNFSFCQTEIIKVFIYICNKLDVVCLYYIARDVLVLVGGEKFDQSLVGK